MPRSNPELDKLEDCLEHAFLETASLPSRVVSLVYDTLDVIRLSRSKIGRDATPEELLAFLEMKDGGQKPEPRPRAGVSEARTLH